MNFRMKTLILSTLLVGTLVLPMAVVSATFSAVENQLIADIKKSQRALSAEEKKIGSARSALARRLRQAELKVSQLRNKTAGARRLSDEKTLSLETLKTRLGSWRQQHQYQSNILAQFVRQVGGDASDSVRTMSLVDKLSWLSAYTKALGDMLYPQWQQRDVVSISGDVHSVPSITVGPMHWFWDESSSRGGVYSEDNGFLKSQLMLSGENSASLNELRLNGSGKLTFDPTLGRAMRLAVAQESLLQHVQKGGRWVVPILLFGLFATVIACFKAWQLFRLPELLPDLAQRLRRIVTESKTHGEAELQSQQIAGLVQQAKGLQGSLLEIAASTAIGQHRDDKLFSELLQYRHTLESWLGAIAITAAVSPLLGLLGTVSGMIQTFKLMTLFGAGDPSAVSSGISEALVTTELGLIVAIPALLLHALLSRRVKTYYSQLETLGINLGQLDVHQSSVPVLKEAV